MIEKEFAASEKAGYHQQPGNVRLKIEPLDDPTILDQVLHITVEGQVVSTTLPQLAEPLLAAILGSDRPVLLDLRGVPDIDSDGLSLLLKLHKITPAEFRPLSLRVAPGSQTERVLNLCGFGMIMTLLPDRT